MTHCPNYSPVPSSPHNTGNWGPEFIRPVADAKPWKQSVLMVTGMLAIGLVSCTTRAPQGDAAAADQTVQTSKGVVQTFLTSPDPSESLRNAVRRTYIKARRLVVPEDGVVISLYIPDDQCLAYIAKEVLVPRQDDLTQTVELILAEQAIPFLELSGYRLSHDPETKTVTIDLRVSRTSPRLLTSLSFCEQKALLGSLKETLVNHPEWNIEQVEFTNRGNRLVL